MRLKKKERERTGVLLYTLLKPMLMSSDAKKMWSGARTCAGANSIKNGFIVLVSSPHQPRQLPLTACLRPRKKNTKSNAILFNVGSNTTPKRNYLASIFDSSDPHSSVNCSSEG